MKIAATYSICGQVSQTEYRDHNVTRIFDGTHTLNDLESWARKLTNGREGWQSLCLSSVEDGEAEKGGAE